MMKLHQSKQREDEARPKINLDNFEILDDDLREELLAIEHVTRNHLRFNNIV
jgi:hypothetical protein